MLDISRSYSDRQVARSDFKKYMLEHQVGYNNVSLSEQNHHIVIETTVVPFINPVDEQTVKNVAVAMTAIFSTNARFTKREYARANCMKTSHSYPARTCNL